MAGHGFCMKQWKIILNQYEDYKYNSCGLSAPDPARHAVRIKSDRFILS